MTREQKLALIVGFALVLFVGVLVSDHLSQASEPLGAGESVASLDDSLTPERTVGFGRPLDVGEPPPTRRPDPAPSGGFIAGTNEPQPIPTGSETGGGLASRFKTVANAIADGAQGAHDMLRDAQSNPAAARTGDVPVIEMGLSMVRDPDAEPAERRAADRTSAERRGWPVHRVAKGESLWGIAERYYGDGALYARLAKINEGRVGDDGTVRVGATILIPPAAELGAAGRPSTTVAERRPEPAPEPDRRYTIRKGDTLGEISQRLLGTSKRWREILELNEDVIRDEDVVPVGVTIRVPQR